MQELRYLARRILTDGDACDAVSHLQALSSGDWGVVDHFEADGRKYVIARRGAGDARVSPEDMAMLSRRARAESLKVIAMELGVSESTVSRRLSSAMKRLGVRSHAELPLLFGAA